MIGVLLAAEDSHDQTYAETVIASVIVIVLYWATSLYTHVLGIRLRTQERLDSELVIRSVLHEVPMIEGAVTPLFVLLLCWVLGASLTTALRAATLATALTIVALELIAGLRARPHGGSVWLRVAGGIVAGAIVVSVKLVLHA